MHHVSNRRLWCNSPCARRPAGPSTSASIGPADDPAQRPEFSSFLRAASYSAPVIQPPVRNCGAVTGPLQVAMARPLYKPRDAHPDRRLITPSARTRIAIDRDLFLASQAFMVKL